MNMRAQSPNADTPFLIIMGAMKCGTTALFEYLRAHPAVCACREKEPGYFAFREKRRAGIGAYFRLWKFDPDRHAIAMEATTNYTKYPGLQDVPARIGKTLHDVRLVYLMRDPVARIESQFNHEIYQGRVRRDDSMLSGRMLDPSRYATQLRQYRAHVPRERILLLDAGELARDPGGVVRRVCAFAGLDPNIDWPAFERVHETRGLTRVEDWLRRGPFPAVHRIPARVRKRIFRGPTVAKQRMNAEERAQAWAILTPELDQLEREYGFDTRGLRAPVDS